METNFSAGDWGFQQDNRVPIDTNLPRGMDTTEKLPDAEDFKHPMVNCSKFGEIVDHLKMFVA
jgi:hypothetical protein